MNDTEFPKLTAKEQAGVDRGLGVINNRLAKLKEILVNATSEDEAELSGDICCEVNDLKAKKKILQKFSIGAALPFADLCEEIALYKKYKENISRALEVLEKKRILYYEVAEIVPELSTSYIAKGTFGTFLEISYAKPLTNENGEN